jgi:SecD/SecF fusion protein
MNRSWQIRVALVVFAVLASLYALIPTFRAAAISSEERALAASDSALTDPSLLALHEKIGKIDAKAIRRGLDLEGGMYLVYEVDQEGMTPEQARDALQRVQEIIRNRIDQFGVSEPIIQTQGRGRIIVQLPGISDPERAKSLIGRTAQLEFRLVRPAEDFELVINKLDESFKATQGLESAAGDSTAVREPATVETAAQPADSALAAADSAAAAASESPFDELPPLPTPTGDELSAEDPYVKEHPFTAYCYMDANAGQRYGTPLFVELDNLPIVQHLLAKDSEGRYERPEARVIPRNMEFQFGGETIGLASGLKLRPLYLLNAQASLRGDRLSSARIRPDTDRPGSWEVEMNLDRKGAHQFAKVTGENIGRYLAISLDGKVNSAPVIRTKIPSGQASITGGYSNQEASDLALLLRAGALPTDVNLEMERTVGPSLGRESIRNGINAALIGGLLVVVFIMIYYRLTGLIVVLALLCNIVILLAVLAQFGLVLTLPGIAGIILTVGMAVDANVLINERVREELRKKKTVRASVDAGYANATRTIVDANLTTLIVGVILLWFGTGPIKGFAVTLCIGILTSMFTALIMTRVIMEYITRRSASVKLSI